MKMEIRTFELDNDAVDETKLRIAGYAAKYRSDSLPLDYKGAEVIETIEPGAFDESIARNDVSFLWQHEARMPLASTMSGTLNLRSDDDGLSFVADLPDTSLARDAMALLRAGVVRQMSFGFFVRREDCSQPGRRILQDIDLREISLVERAAYPEAGAFARSLSPSQLRLRAYRRLRRIQP